MGQSVTAPVARTEQEQAGAEAVIDLSVVIVSWNTRELLGRCLAALDRAVAGLRIETIVVDNSSSDGTPDLVRDHFPAACLIEPGGNLGFAAANNRGIEVARGRILCLLNPDTEPRPGSLRALVEHLDRSPVVGAVGPRLLNPDGSEQAVGFRFPTLAQVALDLFPLGGRFAATRLNGRYPDTPRDRPFPTDFPLGACLAVRREAVEMVGLLDEGYFIYGEEVDWCRRLRAAGWAIECVPTAAVVHHGGQSTGQRSGAMFVELHRSRRRFYRRYHGPAFVRAAQLLTRLGVLTDAFVAWGRFRRGALSRAAWRERVRACGAVFRLA